MAVAYKVLGQGDPLAATQTSIYTVPASTEAVISSITICNRSATATTFRVALLPGGGAVANADYIYYDLPIAGNDTFIATIGATLETASEVEVYATLATLSFNVYGSEITP
jgi:hypothetical protein